MVVQVSRLTPAAEVVRLEDKAAGLDGVIVIHSTRLGPGAGGCRFWHYPDLAAASADAFRLAEGMSSPRA
jgi:leucine dehydrogenase